MTPDDPEWGAWRQHPQTRVFFDALVAMKNEVAEDLPFDPDSMERTFGNVAMERGKVDTIDKIIRLYGYKGDA